MIRVGRLQSLMDALVSDDSEKFVESSALAEK